MVGALNPKLQTHAVGVIERAEAVAHLTLEARELVREWESTVCDGVRHVDALLKIGVLVMSVHTWDEGEEALAGACGRKRREEKWKGEKGERFLERIIERDERDRRRDYLDYLECEKNRRMG